MFPRSERFVEKIEITPGPNHYDVKLSDDDPYKRFGFLGKTKRFNEHNKEGGPGPNGVAGGSGLYGRSSHSASLPSLVIDDDAASIDTASIHSNGSNTPDRVKRPPTSRSKSSDKLGTAFGANSNKAEERLKKELADLTERFERYRIARQKDLDVISEKQRKAELMYQGAIKDKNSIQTQLAAKESEIEKAAALVSDKIGKGALLQKRIDELERLLSRTKLSLEEQESYATEAKQKLDHERQQFQSQLSEQKEAAEQENLRAIEQQKQTEQLYNEEIRKSKDESDAWRIKFEELERQVKELEQKLETERRMVEELRETMKNEREQLQGEIDQANQKIQNMELEQSRLESISKETEDRLQREKQDLDQQLQKASRDYEELSMKHQATARALEEDRARHTEAVETMTRQYDEQQAHFSKERQENLKARQDLEQSIAFLINELGQNRDALLKVQSARAQLQDIYDQSQLELKNMSENLKTLEGQHEELQATFKNEQETWAAKYEALSSASTSQKRESDATISELQVMLEKKNEEHLRVMQSLEATQSELRAVESQREEVIALRAEEERKAAETREEVVRLEQENSTVSQQLASLGKSHEALIAELDQVKTEVQAKEQSLKSLESEIELATSEAKEQESQHQKRIKDLEDKRLVDTKEIEMFQEKQKIWESDRAKLGEEAASRNEEIETLKSKLDKASVERETESKASAERINDLEARCRAMESAFKEIFGKSGSVQEIDLSQPNEIWKQHSTAILDVLLHHTSQCSISKAEYAALLEEKSAIEKTSTSLRATLDSQEDAFKRAHDDHSGLLAKIAELEDQIRHLKAQIEFLEADNIGKEAIIKALQDEYEYQEKIIRDLSKNEDATKEVARLEEELRVMTNRIRETDEWIKEVQEDNKKYREAYVKADIAREETLLDMAKLHEELAESEQARLQVQNQLQVEVSALIKKNGLSSSELSRLSKMDVDSAQNLSLKQKVKQVAQLKEEILVLKKKNLGLSNTRDSLRLKCLQVERDLEAYMAASASGATMVTLSAGNRQARAGSISGSSVVSSSSVSATTDTITSSLPALDQVPNGKLQLQGLAPVVSPARSRSTSTSSSGTPKLKQTGSSVNTKTPIKSRAARSFLAGHSTTS
ncbi:hypothetical protein BGZ80_010795 [Entomortierella chlamydospora]|uniref:Uncharacterized protein n=1 Tax=Entomortierella chlamydospora TaxID=101097 RepID=A0A9P6SZH1_9FUNG|nr:hypothetical protein BGZ80_010795 [Entomortierella chlamydospora]